jgi:DNA replication protein DnaC
MAVRQERLIARVLKAAAFREQKALEDFHWDFNRSIKKKQIFHMAADVFYLAIGGIVNKKGEVVQGGAGKAR